MINKKKIACRTVGYGAIGLALFGSSVLLSTSVNQHTNKTALQQNSAQTGVLSANDAVGVVNNPNIKIRSNPTNGFNGLTTPDGKYTYVLITKADNNANPSPDHVGGVNSGIGCVNNETGKIIGQWFLPQDPDQQNAKFTLNYTTNIVFGQTKDGKFSTTTLFVLCGISNLAAAINDVYTDYVNGEDLSPSGTPRKKVVFTTNIKNGPTIKIFKLTVTGVSPTSVSFNANGYYDFVYPSDGTNGYSGFNASGVPYDMQVFQSRISSVGMGRENPGILSPSLDQSMYYAKGINFNGVTRDGPIWNGGKSFQPISSSSMLQNTVIGAFGSYLTYLTYGQNFAYHLNQAYKNSAGEISPDEFIMTTSFVNVDQNIGGLYSATVDHTSDVEDTDVDGILSRAKEQNDWPIPFGYQWLLADIANANSGKTDGVQYSYIDANGAKQAVKWGDPTALSTHVINFLNDQVYPLRNNNKKNLYAPSQIGNLFQALNVGAWFGANWGATTGYIIFSPSKLVGEDSYTFDPNDYRYYYLTETVKRPFDDGYSSILKNSSSSYVFTNVLATDQLSTDHTIAYLLGISYLAGDSTMLGDWTQPKDNDILVDPLTTLVTNTYTTMFCYDWDALSNDDAKNSLIVPLAKQLDNLEYGYVNKYRGIIPPESDAKLKQSFSNWNLVFLGGPSWGVNNMDSSFTIDPTYDGKENAITWQLATKAAEQNPTNLGRRLTYLRHKISFVIQPHDGFVYFTAGTSLEWQNGLSLWDVTNAGSSDLVHNFALPKLNSKAASNIYLSSTISAQPHWSNFSETVWAIKEITQPYGNWGGSTLAFVTSNGIYTASGLRTVNDKVVFTGTVNNVLAYSSNDSKNVFASAHPEFLKVIAYTPFSEASGYSDALPNVMVNDTNFLRIENASTGALSELYSVQVNADYLIVGNQEFDGVKVNGVFNSGGLPEGLEIPNELQKVPAAKPLLNANDFALQEGSNIKPIPDINKYTYDQIKSYDLMKLCRDILRVSINDFFNVVSDYNAYAFGQYLDKITDADGNIVSAKILIPVTYSNFTDHANIIYYAPIKSASDQKFNLFYTLNGLKASVNTPPVVIVLKSVLAMDDALESKNLDPKKLASMYGFDDGKTYNQTTSDELNDMFVDWKDTYIYLGKKLGNKFDQSKFKLWLIASLSATTTNGIHLQARYQLDNSSKWDSDNIYLITVDQYNNNPDMTPDLTMQVGSFDFPGMQQIASGGSSAGMIIGVVAALLAAVTLVLGLGIGLPMRKQHKINVLNAKITNKRIDKLSDAVSASFKALIKTTGTISRDVNQLKTAAFHPLPPNGVKPPQFPQNHGPHPASPAVGGPGNPAVPKTPQH